MTDVMNTGFSAGDVVDLVTYDPKEDEFALVIVHSGQWQSSGSEEDAFLAKLNDYLHFVLDGEFYRHYPQAEGKKLRLQLDTTSLPPGGIRKIVSQADEELLSRNIRVRMNLIG